MHINFSLYSPNNPYIPLSLSKYTSLILSASLPICFFLSLHPSLSHREDDDEHDDHGDVDGDDDDDDDASDVDVHDVDGDDDDHVDHDEEEEEEEG